MFVTLSFVSKTQVWFLSINGRKTSRTTSKTTGAISFLTHFPASPRPCANSALFNSLNTGWLLAFTSCVLSISSLAGEVHCIDSPPHSHLRMCFQISVDLFYPASTCMHSWHERRGTLHYSQPANFHLLCCLSAVQCVRTTSPINK